MKYRIGRWSGAARRGHALAGLGALAAAGLLYRLAGPLALEVQIVMGVTACLIVGLPHRALDHQLGRVVFAPLAGRLWGLPYGAFYLGLALLVLAGWSLAPGWTLAGLVALSVVHLGLGDLEEAHSLRFVEVLTRGGAPIALAVLFHSADVARLVGLMTGDLPQAITAVFVYGLPLAIAWQALYAIIVGRFLWLALTRSSTEAGVAAAELALLVLVFAALPPVLALALHFSMLHAPRHIIDVAALREPGDPVRALATTALGALPLSLAGAACLAALFLAMRDAGAPASAALRLCIIAVTAVGVPHAILTAASTRPLPERST